MNDGSTIEFDAIDFSNDTMIYWAESLYKKAEKYWSTKVASSVIDAHMLNVYFDTLDYVTHKAVEIKVGEEYIFLNIFAWENPAAKEIFILKYA
jgi:hypothetical protein